MLYRTLLSITLLLRAIGYCGSFEQKIVVDTSLRMLENTPDYSGEEALVAHRRIERDIQKGRFSLKRDLYMVFRYRDRKFIPFWQKLIRQNPQNVLLKIWFIDALCQLQKPKNLALISPYAKSDNDIIRECAANAYGFLAPADSIPALTNWLSNENNDYIRETIKSSIVALGRGGYRNLITYLPVHYKVRPEKIGFFYNRSVKSDDEIRYTDAIDDSARGCRGSSRFIFPTQQFFDKIRYAPNAGSFGNKHGSIYHVGFDGASFFEGLPVHSISNGIVQRISHDLSWGMLVAVETCTPADDTLTIIYGHLSRFVSIAAGDSIYIGQRIGQIGNSVSFDNGGYWAHLHLGIVKAPYTRASIVGYDQATESYENPLEFIARWRIR
jgi:hypothetical protein